jgi:hypothetical protein
LTLLIFGFFVPSAPAEQKVAVNYDGHWWLSITSGERQGFLDGYYDCYTYEYNGPARFTTNPPARAIYFVTQFYEGDPTRLNQAVSDAYYRFRDRPDDAPAKKDEPMKEPHRNYYGLAWQQMGGVGGKASQLGFVEGYLWCHAHLSQNKGGTYSKSPSEYAALITQWYRYIEATNEIDTKREPAKIADVLFNFRDRP